MESTYTAKEIEKLLTLPCCHITGMHNPLHYEESLFICNSQIEEAFRNLCKVLMINPKVKHKDSCGWCCNHPEKTKGDGKEFWDKQGECINCGNTQYTHEPDSYEGYCKDFVPTTFKNLKKLNNEDAK